MSEQKSSLFRKESLERIQSPEQLTDYLKVTNPGIWIILFAIIILLAGLFVWSTVGKLETIAGGNAVVKNGTAQIIVTDYDKGSITPGMPVRFDNKEYELYDVRQDEYGRITAYANVSVSDGDYKVKIVTESISPIKFLLS